MTSKWICIYVKLGKCKASNCIGYRKHNYSENCCDAETQSRCHHVNCDVVFCVPKTHTEAECKKQLLETTLMKNFIKGE